MSAIVDDQTRVNKRLRPGPDGGATADTAFPVQALDEGRTQADIDEERKAKIAEMKKEEEAHPAMVAELDDDDGFKGPAYVPTSPSYSPSAPAPEPTCPSPNYSPLGSPRYNPTSPDHTGEATDEPAKDEKTADEKIDDAIVSARPGPPWQIEEPGNLWQEQFDLLNRALRKSNETVVSIQAQYDAALKPEDGERSFEGAQLCNELKKALLAVKASDAALRRVVNSIPRGARG